MPELAKTEAPVEGTTTVTTEAKPAAEPKAKKPAKPKAEKKPAKAKAPAKPKADKSTKAKPAKAAKKPAVKAAKPKTEKKPKPAKAKKQPKEDAGPSPLQIAVLKLLVKYGELTRADVAKRLDTFISGRVMGHIGKTKRSKEVVARTLAGRGLVTMKPGEPKKLASGEFSEKDSATVYKITAAGKKLLG